MHAGDRDAHLLISQRGEPAATRGGDEAEVIIERLQPRRLAHRYAPVFFWMRESARTQEIAVCRNSQRRFIPRKPGIGAPVVTSVEHRIDHAFFYQPRLGFFVSLSC